MLYLPPLSVCFIELNEVWLKRLLKLFSFLFKLYKSSLRCGDLGSDKYGWVICFIYIFMIKFIKFKKEGNDRRMEERKQTRETFISYRWDHMGRVRNGLYSELSHSSYSFSSFQRTPWWTT